MVDYKHQECRYVFFATEGDVRRWGRYAKKSLLRRILRDIKWLNI
jgi:hypothetical protein